MRRDREAFERAEELLLAPYSVHSGESLGRSHPEPEHPYRTVFQRDRDRIIHTTAFRRLEYKTQVFVYHEGDYYRTRLTHTLETAQIGRTIARALGLNEDLAEAIALTHDIGHPPFGHAGEAVLEELMQPFGGFDHNLHAIRIVTLLERRYSAFPGLNLTWEVLEGIRKHWTEYDSPAGSREGERFPSLEAQVVNVADEIAYVAHDLDDGLRAGILTSKMVATLGLWREVAEGGTVEESSELSRHRVVGRLINLLVDSVLDATSSNLLAVGPNNVTEVRTASKALVELSTAVQALETEARQFLFREFYQHPRVTRMREQAGVVIRAVFDRYRAEPLHLPPHIAERTRCEDVVQVVCDYVAGMTDRFALREFARMRRLR